MIVGKTRYPFVLKSRAKLLVGQFWTMPIFGERFACGRILRLPGAVRSPQARLVVVGIYEWLGQTAPTEETIARRTIVAEGIVHVRALRENQVIVQEFRRLSLDRIKVSANVLALPEWSGEALKKVVAKALRDLR